MQEHDGNKIREIRRIQVVRAFQAASQGIM
jgi:hypothetical protein